MQSALVAACITLPLAPLAAAAAPTYYVSLAGNDAWSGTLASPNGAKTDGPFATLAGARDAIRAERAAGRLTGPATVSIRAGKHCLDETLSLGPDDGGLTFAAYRDEKPQVIGGRFISGLKPGPDGVWSVELPEVKAGLWSFRSLFADGKRMIRARHPNFDPSDPYRKGFAYTAKDPSGFGVAVGSIHNVGDWMDYAITVPADGEYTFWVYYGALNGPFGNATMDGRTAVSIDGGDKVPLSDLPDTESWAASRWGKCATLSLTAGEHTLRWENLKGGGLDLEAYALSDDPAWVPAGTDLPSAAAGKHVVLIQAESFTAYNGPQLQVTGSSAAGKDRFFFEPGDIRPEWAAAPDAEVHIFQTGDCRAFKEICWIDRIDADARCIYLKGPECTSDLYQGDRYFVENVRDALDAPGEWYLDREAGVLYLKPPAGFSRESEVMAPTVGRIVEAIGAEGQPVTGLTFQGLTFRGGDWDFGDGCEAYGMGTNGVIYMKGASRCAVTDCTFVNIGKDAVCLEGGEANEITRNDISDSAEGGININGGANATVSRNHIHHCGQVYKHNGGVTLHNGASACRVRANVIHDMTRYGITMKTAGHDNLIEHNRVLNTNLETFDSGAIEVTQHDKDDRSGTRIIGNIVGDTIGYSSTDGKPCFLSWSIYLDSFAGGYTVENNVCFRAEYGGIMFQGGKDNRVVNNILVGGQVANGHISNFAGNQTGCTLERNVFCLANPAAGLFSAGPLTPEVIRMGRNVFWCPEGGDGWQATLKSWQESGLDEGSVIADPLFVDAAADDYRLKADSPALKLGFEPIDTSQVPSCECHIDKLGPVYFGNRPWPAR